MPDLPPVPTIAAPKERPIIFSAPMVRAILADRKTMTRRLLRKAGTHNGEAVNYNSPYRKLQAGDLLWVREAWRTTDSLDKYSPAEIARQCLDVGYLGPWTPMLYLADNAEMNWERGKIAGRQRASMHMPRWCSRITLKVTAVKIERLQDISYEDCRDEGTTCPIHGDIAHVGCSGLRRGFKALWCSLHGDDAWDANPEVVAISFERIHV